MTSGNIFNSRSFPPRILVAPLDWGLGHATRCIPIINYLLEQRVEVLLAASGDSYILLKKEFPEVPIFLMKGIEIRYARHKKNLPFKLLLQLPGLLRAVHRERLFLKKMVHAHHIDAVISDNRAGMHYKKIPCVYITHQLSIKTANRFTETILRQVHNYYIKKFNACWVPDDESPGLAGALSHPAKLLPHAKYMGPLSRFRRTGDVSVTTGILVILSGPEPQRTLLEQIILAQLKNTAGTALVVRGLPGDAILPIADRPGITIRNYLDTGELQEAILGAGVIICRSGYSSIMDLVTLGRSAILVPTPGQTEQEYLGHSLMQRQYFYCMPQDEFDLERALEIGKTWHPVLPVPDPGRFKNVVDELVRSLNSGNFAP